LKSGSQTVEIVPELVAPQAAGRRDLSAQTAPMNGDDSVPFALWVSEWMVGACRNS